MAGVFLQHVKIFNRAPIDLAVFFDGERKGIPTGFFDLPAMTVYCAKNQNPIMGSGDPDNPHVSGTRYLITELGDEGYGVPLTPEEWASHLGKPCRWDEQAAFVEKYGNDPKAKLVLRGQGKKSTANSRMEAGTSVQGLADFTHKDA